MALSVKPPGRDVNTFRKCFELEMGLHPALRMLRYKGVLLDRSRPHAVSGEQRSTSGRPKVSEITETFQRPAQRDLRRPATSAGIPLDLSRYASEDWGEGTLSGSQQRGAIHGWWSAV